MSGELRDGKKRTYYICGRCRTEQYNAEGEEQVNPCVVCGYQGLSVEYEVLPSDIKMDPAQY